MINFKDPDYNEELLSELRECADLLLDKLHHEDFSGVIEIVHSLIEARDKSLFNEVGKLTRGLHSALVDFHIDSSVTEKDEDGLPETMDDASLRLDHVIKMMKDAADKTMDSVDEISPVASQFSSEASALKNDWEKLRRREISPEEFRQLYGRIDGFLDDAVNCCNQLNNHLQEIILAQSFQDLTGQLIRHVINMVKDVESNMVDLVRSASQIEKFTGLVSQIDNNFQEGESKPEEKDVVVHGPQIRQHTDIVKGQDEVDDLLSSLGF